MTLLVTVFAAVASTAIWYVNAAKNDMKVGVLCWLYWGASIMWLADAIYEYAKLGASFFAPSPANMLNDFYLGLYVVALGLVIWIVVLLVTDPKGAVRAALFKKKD